MTSLYHQKHDIETPLNTQNEGGVADAPVNPEEFQNKE